jgi:putative radical SAM enzyme (TIGR03279 family)
MHISAGEENMVKINSIIPGSPAAKVGLAEGDLLSKINGHGVKDVLDYMYYAAETSVTLEIVRHGEEFEFHIEKDEYDDLGLEFETFLMDSKQSCSNKCVFCFIDQMPPGMRETLYFKDDDARLSFLQGNYVTLTNLKQEDIDRIIEMKLNINVSVHTTNPELRVKMMHNRFAGEKLKFIWQLAKNGIKLNCQIVCCPGLNDGDELRRSLRDLGELMPNITSMAVVPVGVTKFREGLYPLETFTPEGAGETIDIIESFQKEFLEKFGTRTVFPSDEFYLIAGRPIPPAEVYEDYPQYENGVGMLRSLMDEFYQALDMAEWEGENRIVSIATGYSAYGTINTLAKAAENKFPELKCNVYRIRNDFFGETITVSGLITAQDLMAQLKGKELGEELLLPSSMLRRDSDIFLDDIRVPVVEETLGVRIKSTNSDGYELLDAIMGIEY